MTTIQLPPPLIMPLAMIAAAKQDEPLHQLVPAAHHFAREYIKDTSVPDRYDRKLAVCSCLCFFGRLVIEIDKLKDDDQALEAKKDLFSGWAGVAELLLEYLKVTEEEAEEAINTVRKSAKERGTLSDKVCEDFAECVNKTFREVVAAIQPIPEGVILQ